MKFTNFKGRQFNFFLFILELNTASHNRSLQDLDKAIARAKAANYDSLLDLQIVMAGRLRDQLHRIEKLRHSVLNMDNRTIAEIRTYGNPPDGVHQSLQAAFLLLGHSKKDVKVTMFNRAGCLVRSSRYMYCLPQILNFLKLKSKNAFGMFYFPGLEDLSKYSRKDGTGFRYASHFRIWSQGLLSRRCLVS